MKVFLNPGHAPNGNPDPGACGNGLSECDIAKEVADLVEKYLVAAGVEVVENLQSDNLYYDGEGPCVVEEANACGADIFVSIHCNSATVQSHGGLRTINACRFDLMKGLMFYVKMDRCKR